MARGDQFDGLKRRFFLAALPIISLAGVADWIMRAEGDSSARPVLAIFIPLALSLLLWRKRRSQRFVEVAAISWAAATLLSLLYAVLFASRPEGVERLYALNPWFSACLVAIFLVLGPKRAIQVATGIYGAAVIMGIAYLVQARAAGQSPVLLRPLLHLFLANAACITFLFYYACVQEQFERTRNLARCMADLANTDPLLGIPNRRQLYAMLREEVLLAEDGLGKPAVLIMFDLDRFKEVNDTFGHEEGDRVLQIVVAAVKQTLRGTDRFGRWGGDEFMVLGSVSDLSQANILAQRLREAVHQRLGDRYRRVTISLGVAPYHRGDTVEGWVKRADQALYRAKEAGRNLVVVGS